MENRESYNETNQFPQTINGFNFYQETNCEFNCLFSIPHYHCQSCGLGISEMPHVQSHKDICLGYPFQNNISKNVFSQNKHSNDLSSSYTSNFDTMSFPLNSNNPPSLTNTNISPGNHFLTRNSISVPEPSPVFNALLSNQTNSFYNTMFGVQTSHNNQNSYSSSYPGFSCLESPWLTESLIQSSNPPIIEPERNNKSLPFNESNHACYPNRLAILDVGLASPRGTDPLKKDFSSKCVNTDSSNWFCNQNIIFNKNSNIHQTNYKCNDQYSYALSNSLNAIYSQQNPPGSCFTPNIKSLATNSVKKLDYSENIKIDLELDNEKNNLININNIPEFINQSNITQYSSQTHTSQMNKDFLDKSKPFTKAYDFPISNRSNLEMINETNFLKSTELSTCALPLDSSDSLLACSQIQRSIHNSLIPNPLTSLDNQSEKDNNDIGRNNNNECSSIDGESDIIVEETPEDLLIEDEILRNQLLLNNLKNSAICFLCNNQNENSLLSLNFMKVTLDNPVTKMKQLPIIDTLSRIVQENIKEMVKLEFLCNYCFELIDSYEEFETKLANIKLEINSKFKSSTCFNENFKSKQSKNIPIKKANTLFDNNINENLEKNSIVNNCHDSKKDLVCNICNKSFTKKLYLKKHYQQHTKTYSYFCERCGKGFIWRKTFRNHMLIHDKNYKYQCEICGKRFIESYLLKIHLGCHNGEFRFKCNICNKGFMNKTSFKYHIISHSSEKPFVCEHCGKSFRYISNLKSHIKLCYQILFLECKSCNKNFSNLTELKLHKRTNHEVIFKLKCEICDKGFMKNSSLKKHLLSHSREKPFKCDTCGKFYTSSSNLNHHLKTHNNDKQFKCDICDKYFLRRDVLESHKNIHNNYKPFKCDKCEKSFTENRNLQTHLKRHSGTLKKIQCEICNKIITHSYKVHLLSHTGEKPHKCSFCNSSFSVKSSLNKHIKYKHKFSENI